MSEKFSMVYIDDAPDTALSRYLDTQFHSDNYEIEYSELRFSPDDGYESLLSNPTVRFANIIFVDSRLFENRTASLGKFTGEEFKLVLKKYLPFIEVIVITQNDTSGPIRKIAKYDKSYGTSPEEYYSNNLPPLIDDAVNNIRQYREVANLMKDNDSWEENLKEKVLGTLSGTNSYDELTKADIDSLIDAFKKIQVTLDE